MKATADMADLANPELVYEPYDEDIPVEKIYGKLEPDPENCKHDLNKKVGQWLHKFNSVLQESQGVLKDEYVKRLETVVSPHASWKDHYALSWEFRQFHGIDKIAATLQSQMGKFQLQDIEADETAEPSFPGGVNVMTLHEETGKNRIPLQLVQVIVKSKNKFGNCVGFIRLISVKNSESTGGLKAYNIYTCLDNIFGNEERIRERRPQGVDHGQNDGRRSWLEERKEDFKWGGNKHPTVLIVGGGQSGLNTAARLKAMGIESLIVERNKRIGDNWRNRYKFLVLHDPVWYDHLSYIPFPENWPIFTPKDKVADWFEAYANSMELCYWTNKSVVGAEFDDHKSIWSVKVLDNDTNQETVLKPKYVVMSTGHSGEPNIPHFKDQEKFKGTIVHSSKHTTGKLYEGQNAIVVGCCNSGHDIAHDFYEQGAKPTIVQRSTTCVFSSEIGLKITTEGLYEEGGPKTDIADLCLQSMSVKLLNLVMQQQCRRTAVLEKELLDNLKKSGFKLDFGYGGTGLFGKYFRRGGGYYIDVGCSKLISDGKIGIKQGAEIERFTENGIVFADGTEINNLAIVVLATGYSNMKDTARRIFGPKVAERLDPVWGLNDEGETKVIWRDSGHPKFYYMGGNLALTRYYSKKLALRIVAEERGFIP